MFCSERCRTLCRQNAVIIGRNSCDGGVSLSLATHIAREIILVGVVLFISFASFGGFIDVFITARSLVERPFQIA